MCQQKSLNCFFSIQGMYGYFDLFIANRVKEAQTALWFWSCEEIHLTAQDLFYFILFYFIFYFHFLWEEGRKEWLIFIIRNMWHWPSTGLWDIF